MRALDNQKILKILSAERPLVVIVIVVVVSVIVIVIDFVIIVTDIYRVSSRVFRSLAQTHPTTSDYDNSPFVNSITQLKFTAPLLTG